MVLNIVIILMTVRLTQADGTGKIKISGLRTKQRMEENHGEVYWFAE